MYANTMVFAYICLRNLSAENHAASQRFANNGFRNIEHTAE